MKSRLAEITSGVGHKTSWLIRRYDGLLTLLAWYVEQAGSVQLSGVRLSVCRHVHAAAAGLLLSALPERDCSTAWHPAVVAQQNTAANVGSDTLSAYVGS